MSGSDVRASWLRGQVLLVLLVPALVGAFGQPMSIVVALGALTLVCATVTVLVSVPAASPVALMGERLRAWAREQSEIRCAEAPNRAGRPHPRAPGAGSAAPVC